MAAAGTTNMSLRILSDLQVLFLNCLKTYSECHAVLAPQWRRIYSFVSAAVASGRGSLQVMLT